MASCNVIDLAKAREARRSRSADVTEFGTMTCERCANETVVARPQGESGPVPCPICGQACRFEAFGFASAFEPVGRVVRAPFAR